MSDVTQLHADGMSITTGTNFISKLHNKVLDERRPEANKLPSPFVVCVTGASRGIGAQTALTFARAGASGLIITARSTTSLESTIKLCQEASPSLKITPVALEAGSEDQTASLAETIKTEYGRLDVLINNAGLPSSHESAFAPKLTEVRYDQFQVPMQANYFGRVLTMQACLPILLSSPGGAKTIINVTSICSHLVGMGPMGFNVSELASNRLTEIVAERYKADGVKAFSVHPGEVNTGPGPVGAPAGFTEILKDDPDLCGSVCLWLTQGEKSWLSGRYISSEWDLEELKTRKDEIVNGDKLKSRLQL
ncbi:NAD(P)-binding protein [Pseudovirgaria hyperparasitica]|uniref:NAD(P)-binding protein n=1 Tax=Pseudovirgaria hyperparasitica TaxID=470096 RepID=A0A6A6W5E2_9PEZI|nr:NAD(P)-binding protein [Pseudovirgaria hyperparasitica]KAF2758092.1 NAD(P)-binding protein [Pseudovirgaria hyperparasitica]